MKNVILFIKRVFSFNRKKNSAPQLPVCGHETVRPVVVKREDISCVTEQFLKERFDFRINLLTEATEFRPKNDSRSRFRTVGQREMNSLCILARREGIDCWDKDVSRYINSAEILPYHPFRQYMDELSEWDGTDRLTPLARRVSRQPLWIEGFSRWMLALAAQWTGRDAMHANSVAPVLVSRKQGMHKSTFCKMLLPYPLQDYYTDSFGLTANAGAEQKLTAFGLINLDEFDKLPAGKTALLKNLMQMAGVSLRKAYRKSYCSLPRIASFIATSNQKEILADPTGSRRFLCVEVGHKIDCSPIEYEQLYAQLKSRLDAGERYWFTTEDEAALTENNAPFRKQGMDYELFYRYYHIPAKEEEATLLPASDIFEFLKKQHPAAMRSVTPRSFGKTLLALGLERIHRNDGNYYRVRCKCE
jgi:predicted P-loop ATPase